MVDTQPVHSCPDSNAVESVWVLAEPEPERRLLRKEMVRFWPVTVCTVSRVEVTQ